MADNDARPEEARKLRLLPVRTSRTAFSAQATRKLSAAPHPMPREAGIGLRPLADTPDLARQDRVRRWPSKDDVPRRSLSFGPFRLYPAERVIERDGARLGLGSRALDILIVLAERAGEVVSHKELIHRVWRSLVVTPSCLRVHIAVLRKALGDGQREVRYIANVASQGYCFVAPIRRLHSEESGVYALDDPTTPTAAFDPSLKTARRQLGVAEAAGARLASDSQSLQRKHNLPSQLTSFFGREKELQQLKGLLASARLLTLTGAGGCGKTRLATRVAAEVLDDFPDGCWLVDLAPLREPALVLQAIAGVLAIKEQASRLLAEVVVERIATRRLLVLLDNAEHLLEPCANLADLLLRRCPGLKVVVTSREPLGVNGEQTCRVPSLSTPETGDATSEAILECEAARLFVERARLQCADFQVTPQNIAALTSICHRLDGNPLALELAASRTRTMSIEELARRLDDRFAILTGGNRTAIPRHRTLRSSIDWSYDLLSTAEKTLLRRVAVFAGEFTVDGAECVCAGDGIERGTVFDVLTSLTDKSVLVAERRGSTTRFGMLESVHCYASERLHESGEEEPMHVRHREYFMTLAGRQDETPDDAKRRRVLRAVHNNASPSQVTAPTA